VADAVGEGVVPKEKVDDWVIVCSVFIHPEAKDYRQIYQYNYGATKLALKRALANYPSLDKVLYDKDRAKHPIMGFKVPRLWRPPYLQIALDNPSLERAKQVVTETPQSDRIILEVGTPLLKKYGTKAVRELRDSAKDYFIVADLKTLDVGKVEVDLAFEETADAVVASGLAAAEVLDGFIYEAKRLGIYAVVDMMEVADPVRRQAPGRCHRSWRTLVGVMARSVSSWITCMKWTLTGRRVASPTVQTRGKILSFEGSSPLRPFTSAGAPETLARLKEITVDPKTVVLAKKVEGGSVGVPKAVSLLVPGTYNYASKIEAGGQSITLSLKQTDGVSGSFSTVSDDGTGVNFHVTDPYNNTILHYDGVLQRNFSFTAEVDGNFQLHFDNSLSPSYRKTVSLNYDVTHYIMGLPQEQFLMIIVVAVAVIGLMLYAVLMPK
jgi:hypothetical protein